VASFVADLLVFFAATYRSVFGFPAPPLHDPCAVAAVIDPSILKAQVKHPGIECRGL
jgi:inosine-uridine nucleoside N-ribohydrolase